MNCSKKREAAKKAANVARAERNRKRDEALAYIDAFNKEYGNKGYISLRIRDGYIGKELSPDGRKLQTARSRPHGTLVAIKGDNEDLKIGYDYLSNTASDIPAVGIMEALKVARGEKEPFKPLKKRDADLAEFFSVRARCFFWPKKYSHDKGSEPLEYKNYVEIHKNRKRVLGGDA